MPLSIIHRVIQTKASILLNATAQQRDFKTDPYFDQRQGASIFCFPLLGKQDQLTAILYLENPLPEDTFSGDRVKLLNLISSPAALCIANAQLYKQLGAYSRSLEDTVDKLRQAQQISQGQTAALTSTLNAITREPELDNFSEKVLAAITKQLNAPSLPRWELGPQRVTSDPFIVSVSGDGGLGQSLAEFTTAVKYHSSEIWYEYYPSSAQ